MFELTARSAVLIGGLGPLEVFATLPTIGRVNENVPTIQNILPLLSFIFYLLSIWHCRVVSHEEVMASLAASGQNTVHGPKARGLGAIRAVPCP